MVQKNLEKATSPNKQKEKRKKHVWLSGGLHIEGRLNEWPRLQRIHRDENEAKQNQAKPEKDVMASANQTPGGYRFAPLVASQPGRANQHEPAWFGLSSPWSFPSSRSGIPLHAVVKPWLPLQRSRSAPFSLVLGCSRPLVGVDADISEVVQETPHLLFILAPHTGRAPPVLQTSRTSAVSYPPCAPQIPQTRSASCVKSPRCSHFVLISVSR